MIMKDEQSKGEVSLGKFLYCPICKKIPIDPLRMQCCDFLICQSECSNQKLCVKCSQPSIALPSSFVNKLFKSIQIKCQHGCGESILLSQISSHEDKCPKNNTQCRYCKRSFSSRLAVDHMLKAHAEESSRLILAMHQDKEEPPLNSPKEQKSAAYLSPINQAKPFMHFQRPKDSRSEKLNSLGRYTCGRPKIDGNFFNFVCSQQQFMCSEKGGSCNSCMKLDIVRLGLMKGQLLNLEGRLCKFNNSTQTTNCGITFQRKGFNPMALLRADHNFICENLTSCPECVVITNLIRQFKLYLDFI